MDLIVNSTYETPSISFCENEEVFLIKGRAISNTENGFWKQIQDWVTDAVPHLNHNVVLTIEMDYINAYSVKELMQVISSLNTIKSYGHEFSVVWMCDESEESETFFIGQDIANTFNCPFEFVNLSQNN